jgi:hypothetical protein
VQEAGGRGGEANAGSLGRSGSGIRHRNCMLPIAARVAQVPIEVNPSKPGGAIPDEATLDGRTWRQWRRSVRCSA